MINATLIVPIDSAASSANSASAALPAETPAPDVTVWSKSNCQQCTATKRRLDSKGIAFQEKNLEDDPEQTDLFIRQGLTSAPIVVTPDEAWAGFRPDLIDLIETADVAA